MTRVLISFTLSHHLVKNNRMVALEKLHSKEIYSLIISQDMSTIFSNFVSPSESWLETYLSPTSNTN